MGAKITPLSGQSNFDVLLTGYGNFDYFIKMLSDSSVPISSTVGSSYIFDTTLKNINSNFTGIDYSTAYQVLLTPGSVSAVLTEDSGFVITEDGGIVLTQ